MAASCKQAEKKAGEPSAEKPTPAGSGSAPAPTSAFANVSIVKDGKPMPIANALVKQLPDGKLQLYLGEGGTCAQLLTNVFDGKQQHILLDLPVRLAPDGTETRTVSGVYMGPPEDADPGATAAVKGDLAKGSKVAIDFAFSAKAAKLEGKGSLVAESCGDQDVSKGPLPKADHPSTATMTIANKRIPIRAALVKGERIELSDFPRDCIAAWFIGASLKKDTGWHLSGQRFEKPVDGEGAGLTVLFGTKGASADGPTVQLTLGGEGKVGDYPVKLDGTIEALACP